MTFQCYEPQTFKPASLDLIEQMNRVIRNWQAQGYTLTVRQLYCQMVAGAIIENTVQSYKRLASLVSNARMAGLMRWDAIEDRTREFITRTHWNSPHEVMNTYGAYFHMDMWETQPCRVYVIVEKEALTGILEDTCSKYDVPLLAARGYASVSVLREFAQDMLMPALDAGQNVTILHLGDHDPSGIDMTRDLRERLEVFCECDVMGTSFDLERIALTMDQISAQRPPPNPAKETDARFADYKRRFGDKSWELDALSPRFMNDLVETHISNLIDDDEWEKREQLIQSARDEISRVSRLIKWEA